MGDHANKTDRLLDLAGAVCNMSASEDELAELYSLLATDRESRYSYADYCQIHAALRFELRAHRATDEVNRQIISELNAPAGSDLVIVTQDMHSAIPLNFTSTAPYAAFTHISSSWPAAYLIATMIFAVGALLGAFITVSQPTHLALESLPISQDIKQPQPESTIVGQITGMADCQWVGTDRITREVAVGSTYKLASGLVEITYETGARVILRGPVTYEVNSGNGGYLSMGKLTARLEQKVTRGQRSVATDNHQSTINNLQSSDPQSLIPIPLFAVRTPTAVVTDLGTEFGVEVASDNSTQVHVFEGHVSIVAGEGSGRGVVLDAGSAVRVSAQGNEIESATYNPASFQRALISPSDPPACNASEQAYIDAVLADKPMGYWPLNEPARSRTVRDRSGNAINGYGMNAIKTGVPGPFGEQSRALALDGNGYIDLGRHDEFARPNDFTVEAWIWTDKPLLHSTVFSAVGVTDDLAGRLDKHLGWGFSQYLDESQERIGLRLTCYHEIESPKDTVFSLSNCTMPLQTWTHAAMVIESNNMLRLYVNGKCVESQQRANPVLVGPVWLSIGTAGVNYPDARDNERYWNGRLAHVAVYPRTLGAEQIRNHYTKIISQQSD